MGVYLISMWMALSKHKLYMYTPSSSATKNPLAIQEMYEMQVPSLGWKDPLGEEMATHSSILAWRISWMEEPGRLQSMELQRIRHY